MSKAKMMLRIGLLLAAFGAAGAAHAGGHWVCRAGFQGSPGINPESCWWKDDSIEYRGKADFKSVDQLMKEAKEQAEKDAAALDGQELVDADATANINADIATVRALAFRDRLKQMQAEDKKKGVKHRGDWYGMGELHDTPHDFKPHSNPNPNPGPATAIPK